MNDKTMAIGMGAFFLAVMLAAAFLCLGGRANLSDNGGRADEVRGELGGALDYNRRTGEALDRAEAELGELQKGIHEALDGTYRLEEGNRQAETILGENREILRRVRARGKKETK